MNLKKRLFIGVMSLVFYILRIFPVKRNKIVFSNFAGKGFGDNPKYIYEALKKLKPDIYAVWLVNKQTSVDMMPSNIKIVKNRSLRKFYELATAKVWVDNCRKSEYIKKRKEQYYIMTWHAGLCLKKVEKDAEEVLGVDYIRYAKADAKQIDLMVSNSKWCTELYKRAFWYNGEITEYGLPRNDIFLKIKYEKIQEIKHRLGINLDKKLAIYAPTFRKDFSVEAYNIDFNRIIKVLNEKFEGDWIFLLRLHPSMKNLFNVNRDQRKNIIDVSKYGDIYEILPVCDILITDYSSISFDFALTKRPVFIYATDLLSYNKERGTYFDLRYLPFPFSDTNDLLIHNIENFDKEQYKNEISAFFDKLGVSESGTAANKIATRIVNIMNV